MKPKKVALLILDGWGIAKNPRVSAIDAAYTPFYDKALETYPHSRLKASGTAVGLPEGQMGNSEVGHMNIGAGRIVFQELERISKSIREKEIVNIPEFSQLVNYCKANQKPLHLMGLLSDGGVHSSLAHLKGLISLFAAEGLKDVFIHCFTDGRDTDPKSGLGFIEDLESHLIAEGCGKIASVIGRYYAMDRDQRWGRIRNAYDLMLYGTGQKFNSAKEAIQSAYNQDITDEFIKASVICSEDKPVGLIQDGDALLCYNFRSDRVRQLSVVLTQRDVREYNMVTLPSLYYTTMTEYDESYENVHVLFKKENLYHTLGEILSQEGKKQLRIAETEKYPHVTFFFNGGREAKFPGEDRILCPSPRVATYDLKPEMSASEITENVIFEIKKNYYDFICLNFANADMVGHTGIFEAAVKACETVDQCLEQVVNACIENGYAVVIIADHGNADKMKNEDGSPNTAHSLAEVPFIVADSNDFFKLKEGVLGDVAPTILQLMGLPIPPEMTGHKLIDFN
jgi:2,3-bisphosphoglycerate-independent phosphoglycerate mutase